MGRKERAVGQLASGPGKTGPLDSGPGSSWEIPAPSTPPQRVLVWRVESCAMNLLWRIWVGPWLKKSFASQIHRRGVNAGPGAARAPHGIPPRPWRLPLQVSTSSHMLLMTDEWAGNFTPFSFFWYSFQTDYFHMVQNSKDPKIYRVESPSFLSASIPSTTSPQFPEKPSTGISCTSKQMYTISLSFIQMESFLYTLLYILIFFIYYYILEIIWYQYI